MMKSFFLFILTIFLFNTAYACETPDKAITAYLNYDFNGERLGSDVSVHIDKLTANPHEPAWDVISLIIGYKIQSIKQNKANAVVKVKFKAAWETARKFQPEAIIDEIIEIHMEKIKGCWKVGPPFYQPHVSPIIAMKHFEKLLGDAKKDNANKDYIDYTSSVLDSVRKYIDTTKRQ